MRYLNQTDEQESLMEILDESDDPEVSWELVNSSKLAELMADAGVPVPYGQGWKRLMSERGFSPLGKVKIGGKSYTFWSTKPDKFRTKNGETDTAAIRDHCEPI